MVSQGRNRRSQNRHLPSHPVASRTIGLVWRFHCSLAKVTGTRPAHHTILRGQNPPFVRLSEGAFGQAIRCELADVGVERVVVIKTLHDSSVSMSWINEFQALR